MTPPPPPPPPHHLSKPPTSNGFPPPPPHLKISHHSHSISKKPSSPSPPQPHHRTPVIIYTHSPKIIHTNPRDFMALVQKLTGMSRSAGEVRPAESESIKNVKVSDEESSSVITTEENSGGEGQVNSSCFAPPVFDPPNPYVGNVPVFAPPDLNQSYYNYDLNYNYGYDSFYFSKPNIISSSALEGLNEFP